MTADVPDRTLTMRDMPPAWRTASVVAYAGAVIFALGIVVRFGELLGWGPLASGRFAFLYETGLLIFLVGLILREAFDPRIYRLRRE